MISTERINSAVSPFGITLTERQGQQFNTYGKFLVEYNQMVNLTAITDPDEIAVKHFADSIAPLSFFELPKAASVIDVGTGAGFPGVPVKLLRGDIELTLLDSLNKRLEFLRRLSEMLGQQNLFIHCRAEQAGADPKLRERYDIAVSRAVARLSVLCEYCLPLVKVGGALLALKGPDGGGELSEAERAIALLGGRCEALHQYQIEGAGARSLIVIKKISPTPKKYPRQRIKLSERPL